MLSTPAAARADWPTLARTGGYPTVAHELDDIGAREQWFAGYTQTYLERDLRELSAIASLVDFRRLIAGDLSAVGNLVNQTELGRDVGMPQPKIRRHLGLLENLVLADLLAWSGAQIDAPTILYWRTASGDEVDFVVESKRALLPVEVKSSTRVELDDARGLLAFHREHGRAARAGLLLHDGERVEWLADRVLAAPWWCVL